jgi:hypothetical protein
MGLEVDMEKLKFLYSGIRWLKLYLTVSIAAMILGLFAVLFIAAAIFASVRELLVVKRIPLEPIMISSAVIYVPAIILRVLYYLGARSASKCFDSLRNYKRVSLILIIYSVVMLLLLLEYLNRTVNEINSALEIAQKWGSVSLNIIEEPIERARSTFAALRAVLSIIAAFMEIYLAGIFSDIGKLFATQMERDEESGLPMFRGKFVTMLEDATDFFRWSFVVSIFGVIILPLSQLLAIVALVLYIIGVVKGYKGLSEIEPPIAYYIHYMQIYKRAPPS